MWFLENFDIDSEIINILNDTLSDREKELCLNFNSKFYNTITYFRSIGITEEVINEILLNDYSLLMKSHNYYQDIIKEKGINENTLATYVNTDYEFLYSLEK